MVPINFDAAFSQQHFRSTSGLVFRNERGEVIVSKSILTNRIASPFAAEAFACFQAVRLGMGVDAVEIERDALATHTKTRKPNGTFNATKSLKRGEELYLERAVLPCRSFVGIEMAVGTRTQLKRRSNFFTTGED
ncbi:hypothetical protein Gorai_013389, partial [Gossypium raimondii]|nr:hypothetical protein [Gossypium raimondii]